MNPSEYLVAKKVNGSIILRAKEKHDIDIVGSSCPVQLNKDGSFAVSLTDAAFGIIAVVVKKQGSVHQAFFLEVYNEDGKIHIPLERPHAPALGDNMVEIISREDGTFAMGTVLDGIYYTNTPHCPINARKTKASNNIFCALLAGDSEALSYILREASPSAAETEVAEKIQNLEQQLHATREHNADLASQLREASQVLEQSSQTLREALEQLEKTNDALQDQEAITFRLTALCRLLYDALTTPIWRLSLRLLRRRQATQRFQNEWPSQN